MVYSLLGDYYKIQKDNKKCDQNIIKLALAKRNPNYY